jgi:hypothetical protein
LAGVGGFLFLVSAIEYGTEPLFSAEIEASGLTIFGTFSQSGCPAVIGPYQGTLDGDDPVLQVNVAPPQADQFSGPQTQEKQHIGVRRFPRKRLPDRIDVLL